MLPVTVTWGDLLADPPKPKRAPSGIGNIRPRCAKCGRFVKRVTVIGQSGYEGEWYGSGECSKHGREEVWYL